MFVLNDSDRELLRTVLTRAQATCPDDWSKWYLAGQDHHIGVLPAVHAQTFSKMLPSNMPLVWDERGWVWHADDVSPSERSHVLQSISHKLYASGEIKGWRNEMYACWGSSNDIWPFSHHELFRIERAAFRYFGLRSHASHVNGVTADGHMWCGRRALTKPTDPGLLDNLAAGGIAAGETPDACAVREIFEEAGLTRAIHELDAHVNEVITERVESEGWHSERLFIYTIHVKDNEKPNCRDAEVSEFLLLNLDDVLARIRNGEFTVDAACSIASILMSASGSY